jgi:hypothetical protein
MPEVGDYVLVKHLKNIDRTHKILPHLPIWAKIIHHEGEYDHSVEWVNPTLPEYRAPWGVDDDDLVPESSITDEQWAQLVRDRLVHNA